MTTPSVLATLALHNEWGAYCAAEGLPCISADELLHEDGANLTWKQRAYITAFIERWEAAQAAEDLHTRTEKTGLQPSVTEYRGLKIEGFAYAPAATERELEDYRRQIRLDVERRNRGVEKRRIAELVGEIAR